MKKTRVFFSYFQQYKLSLSLFFLFSRCWEDVNMVHGSSRRGVTLRHAIAVALGVATVTQVFAAESVAVDVPADDSTRSRGAGELEEILVTATRRSVNLQDVPIAITALTGTTLEQLNVQTLDDFVKYLPNVTTAGVAPGQDEIYMRGLSTTHQSSQVVGGTGAFPNVAVYLDDQSVQLPGRNLDVYAADLARIEVLEGPQGTLYGAGAQAGAVRYITNKPKLDVTDGSVNASYSTTAHGDPSSSVAAMINIPVIPDALAVRAVIYDDSRGGYIHNVAGTFTRSPTDVGIVDYFGGVVPAGSTSLSNANLVSNAFNPLTYQGLRASAFYRFNDDWNFLLQQSYQSMEADGIFAYDPQVGDLDVQQFNPSKDLDKFEDTAWTANGRIGALKLVYTGGYLVRNVNETADYTAYSRGPFAAYYQCNGPQFTPGATATCYSPSATWHNIERNTHQSHEVRVSTPDEARVRALVGIFWEDYQIQTSQNFLYADSQAGFPPMSTSRHAPIRSFLVAASESGAHRHSDKRTDAPTTIQIRMTDPQASSCLPSALRYDAQIAAWRASASASFMSSTYQRTKSRVPLSINGE